MKIVLPDYIYIPNAAYQQIERLGDVTLYPDIPDSEEEVIRRIAGAEIITAAWVEINANVIQKTPSLKYIVVPGVGYDAVDIKAASQAGIRVLNCPTHNSDAVAEYTLGLILALTKKLFPAHRSLQAGNWQTLDFVGTELSGKKLVLIGYGNIGRRVEKLAQAFGMEVSHTHSQTPSEELDKQIASADILSLHLPATPQTHHLLDARRLSLMKPSAYLINTARGAVIEQTALFKMLQEKRIAGAALDVFENEPVGTQPNANIQALANLENAIATPHIAYNTEEAGIKLGEELIANLQSCLQQQPINVVNPTMP
ncbi:MAG: 3-phosphoglycerate dehydrogenase [Desertifilum sp. SIO1I2]|nr:3-phosphoglycerate dehydrogenase [Desertifilum sp. SIO1I2]